MEMSWDTGRTVLLVLLILAVLLVAGLVWRSWKLDDAKRKERARQAADKPTQRDRY